MLTLFISLDRTTISGGYVLDSFFVPAGTGGSRGLGGQNLLSKIVLSLDGGGTVPDVLSVVVTSISGTATLNANITWKEIY